jgi:putative molybdopterin biosynthesis protein
MQVSAGLELLTTAEAADYIRIRERKLYELIAERQVPCTKVTGKWLFPRADLDRWLLAGMARPHGVVPAEPSPIVGGSHDPLLQWALGESRAGLAILPEGSEAGYRRFLRGEIVAAAIHFHDVDDPERDANVEVVSREATLYDAVLIGFAAREQGMLVAAGNPLGISSLLDALSKKARLIVRPAGAGAQQLLEAQLKRDGLQVSDCLIAAEAPTGPDIAQAIRAGYGDYGIATRAVALATGLDFIPLTTERFDLLMRQRDAFRAPLQKLLNLLRSSLFAERARDLGGLNVSGAGSVRWAP